MHLLFLSLLFVAQLVCSTPTRSADTPAIGTYPQDLQDTEEEVEDEREDIAERLEDYEQRVKQLRATREPDPKPLIALLDGFMSDFEGLGPKDRASVVETLGETLNVKRIKHDEDGKPRLQLLYSVTVVLGEMGPAAVKPLVAGMGRKPLQKQPGLLVAMAESLGQIGHPDALKTLTGLLKHKDLSVLAAGAAALGQLEPLDEKTRKASFKHLLKELARFRKAFDKDPDDVEAYQAWGQVSGALMEAMEALSGHTANNVPDWESWWKANQRKPWA